MTPELSLIEQAEQLNKNLEQSYIALGIVLVDISEQDLWQGAGYESFADFYKNHLGREKSTVSRLLDCGRFFKESNLALPSGNLSYKRLSQAIKQFPDKEPEYVLAAAQTWKDDDFRISRQEDICGVEGNHNWGEEDYKRCIECGKMVRK